ncbi:vascular cell adhesion protein 1 isoform X3 [Puntigrus tetrazona]|uniref:vascular cell adhesion protein 1 isoform X3 n=1 Tax=Puntigrus tetrazona TaxID=1606681 RepID=UPI001C8A6E07|nr:vascular cell adhesion protein 1 isoform X3 [Puntigrus tetrazona]
MRGVKCISFALWINILSVMTENDFSLELTPSNPVIHVGEDLELTCRVSGCPFNVTFIWKATLDEFLGGEIKNEQNVSRLLIRNISVKHSNKVVCKATCPMKPSGREKTANIQMFSFPEDPIVPKIKSLTANQTQKLTCTVHNIYPPERFQVEWLRGNTVLHKDRLQVEHLDHVQNYSFVYNYTPSVDDLGKNISCKATMNLSLVKQERTTTAEYGPGTITVSSNNALVKIGEPLEIACHADGNPKPTISWWKLENKPELQSHNHTLIINNASWSQAGWYQCNASNGAGSQQARIKVIVVGPPNIPRIQLSHEEEPKEGESISIFCSSDGRPAKLKLYRQSQTIATGDPDKSAVLLNITSVQTTDAGIYICEAINEFGFERSTINITVQAAQEDIRSKVDLL